jgi:pre-rRNA-processing protein TSR3
MEQQTNEAPKLLVYHANQCDPKKCTGIRLNRMSKAKIVKDMRHIPRGSIVLNPISEIALSPADRVAVVKSGLVALDCSWKKAEDIFHRARQGEQRSLPYLLAANPINTYKPIKLSTAEAVAAAIYILGMKDIAEDIMAIFKWGPSFLTLNREWLDAYANCSTSGEVVEVQTEIMEAHTRR